VLVLKSGLVNGDLLSSIVEVDLARAALARANAARHQLRIVFFVFAIVKIR